MDCKYPNEPFIQKKIKKVLWIRFRKTWKSNVLVKNNVNIDVSSKYRKWQQIYHLGSKNAKSGIQTTIDSIIAKSDVNNSSQITYKYGLEEMSKLYPNDESTQWLKLFENLE